MKKKKPYFYPWIETKLLHVYDYCLTEAEVKQIYEDLQRDYFKPTEGGKDMKPNCYKCENRGSIPGDCHSSCSAHFAHVTGNAHGIKNGRFMWPINFDPICLNSCDSFKEKELQP